MKKLFIVTIVFLFVMLPFTSFTKDVITDSDLDKVTAEEGVSIGFNNFSLGGSAASGTFEMLGETEGYSSGGYVYTSPGYTGASNIIVSGNIAQISGNMTIDVGTSGASTRVNIVLPTITLGAANMAGVMKLSSSMDLSTGKKLGELDVRGFSTQVKSDYIQIFAH
jgi:hypothetical protein